MGMKLLPKEKNELNTNQKTFKRVNRIFRILKFKVMTSFSIFC